SNLRHFDSYALTSDGRWLLYSEFGAVRRTPSSGGPETPLFEVAGMGIVKCAGRASNVCIESRGQGSDAPHLSVFDPAVGHPRPSASLPLVDGTSATSFDVSADGTQVAAVSAAGPAASLVVIDVASGLVRPVPCEPCSRATGVAWAHGDGGWIVTTAKAP